MRWYGYLMLVALVGLVSGSAWGQFKVGKKLPAIEQFETDDEVDDEVRDFLDHMQNRVTVIVFFKVGQEESREAFVLLSELNEKYGPRGLNLGAISFGDEDEAEDEIEELGVDFWVWNFDAPQLRGIVSSFPTAYIIDLTGMVQWRGSPLDELERRIQDQMRRTPPIPADEDTLKKLIGEVEALQARGEIGRAYTLARTLRNLAVDSNQAARAGELVDQLMEDAKARLDEAKNLLEERKYEKGVAQLSMLAVRFAEKEDEDDERDRERDRNRRRDSDDDDEDKTVAEQAKDELAKLMSNRDLKPLIKMMRRNAEAQVVFDRAKDYEQRGMLPEAIELYHEVQEKWEKTEVALEAEKAIERLHTDPTMRKQLEALFAEREADRWLDIGERYAQVGMFEEARKMFAKLREKHPRTPAGRRVDEELAQLKQIEERAKQQEAEEERLREMMAKLRERWQIEEEDKEQEEGEKEDNDKKGKKKRK